MGVPQLFGSYVFFSGGMNAGFDPAAIEDNQYVKGINVVCRGGVLRTRPAFQPCLPLFTPTYEGGTFTQGKFQGATSFDHRLVAVVSGAVFVIDTLTWQADALSSRTGLYLNQYIDRVFTCRVESFLIIQDGMSLPLIYDGSSLRRASSEDDEVPAGTVMAYGHGRLFVKTAPSLFVAGDINRPNQPTAVLKFTETDYLNGGGAFSIPSTMGEIRSMAFATGYDTSTGDGPLLVGGDHGIMSFSVSKPRSEWFNTDLAKQQIAGVGPVGALAGIPLNSDWLFWSKGGLRSYATLKEQSSTSRRFVNLSAEVSPITARETDWMLPLVAMVEFDDRLLVTTVGRRCRAYDRRGQEVEDMFFEALAVVDFNQMDGWAMRNRQMRQAAYDGIWTGLRFTGLVRLPAVGGDRCFAFGKDDAGKNVLWELTRDMTGLDGDVPIMSRLLTRAFVGKRAPDYVDTPFERKRFDRLLLWVDRYSGRVPIKALVKVDGRPFFRYISSVELNAPITVAGVPEGDAYDVGVPQDKPRLLFSAPAETGTEGVSGLSSLTGYSFTIGLEWRGRLEISRLLASLLSVSETRDAVCVQSAEIQPMASESEDLDLNDFVYSAYSGVNYAGHAIPVAGS